MTTYQWFYQEDPWNCCRVAELNPYELDALGVFSRALENESIEIVESVKNRIWKVMILNLLL